MVDYKVDWGDTASDAVTTTVDDYSANITDAKALLKDVRFLSDLRQYYRDHYNEEFSSDEDMIEEWYEDRNFAELNTVSAIRDAARTTSATDNERLRMRRLENVWRALPSRFWDADQRWTAIGDVAQAVLTDPLNLIPGLGAMKAGGHAARLALMGRKTGIISGNATRAALAKGAKTGAISEGVIGGGQEAIVNTAQQLKDVELGFQDEFSVGRLGKATGVGATFGAGIGSIIGVGGGAIGRATAQKKLDELRGYGYSDDEISRMAPSLMEAINPLGRAATKIEPDEEGMVPTYRGEAGAVIREERRAAQRGDRTAAKDILPDDRPEEERLRDTIIPEKKEDVPDPDAPAVREREALENVGIDPDWSNTLGGMIRRAADEISEIRKITRDDRTPEDQDKLVELRNAANELERLRGMNTRLSLEAEEILEGLKSNDLKVQKEARLRQADLRQEVENLRAAIDAHNEGRPITDVLPNLRPREKEPEVAPEAAAPTDATDVADVADVVTPPAAPAAREIPWTGERPKARAADEGITDQDVSDWMDQGGELSKTGKVGVRQLSQIKKWKEKKVVEPAPAEPEVAPVADATPETAPVSNEQSLSSMLDEIDAIEAEINSLPDGLSREELALLIRSMARTRGGQRDFDTDEFVNLVEENIGDMIARKGDKSTPADPEDITERIVDFTGDLNETQKRKYREILRGLKADEDNEGVAEIVLQAQARNMVDHNISYEDAGTLARSVTTEEGRSFAERQQRRFGTGQRVVDAKNLEGAGRSPTTGRIQTILVKGKPTQFEKDASGQWRVTRSVTGEGVDRKTESVDPARYIGRAEAVNVAKERGIILRRYQEDAGGEIARIKKTIRAENKANKVRMGKAELNAEAQRRFDEDIKTLEQSQTIIRYSADEGERLINKGGGPVTIAKRGQDAFWDSMQNRAFASEEAALAARGYGHRVDKKEPTPEPSRSPTTDEVRSIIEKHQNDPVKMLEEIEKLKAPQRAAPAEPDVTPSGASGEKIAAAKFIDPETGDTTYRMMGKSQADKGHTVKKIIGQQGGPKGDIKNWEVRYVPRETPQREKAIQNAFEEADAMPEGADPDAAPIGPYGNVSGYGEPIDLTTDQADKIKVADINEQEATLLNNVARRAGINLKVPFDAADVTPPSYRYFKSLASKLESAQWPAYDDMGEHIEAITLIYNRMAQAAPQGDLLPVADRFDAVEKIGRIFERSDPETAAEARSFISRLGGNKSYGPILKEGNDWHYARNTSLNTKSEVSIGGPDRPVGGRPHLANMYHEVGHWAYENILTPQDRLEFWDAMQRQYYTDGLDIDAIQNRTIPLNTSRGSLGYGLVSPQEYFADQFSAWTMQGTSNGVWKTPGYWEKVRGYVQAIFDRYFAKSTIDPELEPLFAKILPENERMKFKHGFGDPQTDAGKMHKFHFDQLELLEGQIQKAFRADSADWAFDAASMMRDWLAGRFAYNKDDPAFKHGRNFYKGIKPGHWKILRHRLLDLNQILSHSPIDSRDAQRFVNEGIVPEQYEGNTNAWMGDVLGDDAISREVREEFADLNNMYTTGAMNDWDTVVSTTDRDRVYPLLAELYDGAWKPPTGNVKEKSIEAGYTNLSHAFKILREDINASYHLAEGTPLQEIPDSIARNQVRVRQRGIGKPKKLSSQQRQRKSGAKRAAENATTPRRKRQTRQLNTPDVDETTAASVRGMSQEQLADEFVKHEGTPRGDQIGAVLYEKMKTYPVLEQTIPVPKRVMSARVEELKTLYMEAWKTGDFELEEQVAYEVSRRIHNKKNKDQKISSVVLKLSETDVARAIDNEIEANVGVSYDEGIPAQAPARIKSFIAPITHRDPEIQTTARTMLYRMLNLAGNATDKMDEVNVLTVDQVARLANTRPEGSPNAVFSDFRGENYSKLRSDLRRMAVGLNKGEVTPIEVMHEVSHAVLRSAGFPEAERKSIVDAFDVADGLLKERAFARARKNYPGENDAQIKEIAAEEWFVEGFSQYLAKRVSKNDAFKMSEQGEIEGIKLRGSLDRAIDRLVEYVVYVTNGLIGRNDVKQTYRRMMFYGDVFEKPTNPILDLYRNSVGVPRTDAAKYSNAVLRYSPENRRQSRKRFVDTGNDLTSQNGEPIIFYHGTPWGQHFDRNIYPDVVLRGTPGRGGVFGRGTYLALDPNESDYYSKMPTYESWQSQIESKGLSKEKELEALSSAQQYVGVQRDIWNLEAEIADLRAGMNDSFLGDQADINKTLNESKISDLEIELAGQKSTLMVIAENLVKDHKLDMQPLVMPVVVRAKHTARFDNTRYEPDDGFVVGLADRLQKSQAVDDGSLFNFFKEYNDLIPEERTGRALYGHLLKTLIEDRGLSREVAVDHITNALEDMGYDSLRVMHFTRGQDNVATFSPSMVVFDNNKVKHVDADVFNEADDRLYHSDFQAPVNIEIGRHALAKMNDNETEDIVLHLKEGVPPGVASGMGKIEAGKQLDVPEIEALQKANNVQLQTNSSRMIQVGFKTIGQWFKDYHPAHHRRFSQKYFALKDLLTGLPDGPSALKSWTNKVMAPISSRVSEQPKSWSRIARAMRRGTDSEAFNLLSKEEKKVANSIFTAFRQERQDLVNAGVYMGNRGDDYFPQVWDAKHITKNGADFRLALADYFVAERRATGMSEDDISKMQETNDFKEMVNKIYRTLADGENDGITFPDEARNVSAGSENIDFARMIELDKHPEALKGLEPFLQDDMDFILTKYFEASTRKIMMTEKFGVNNHGIDDYMRVMEKGKEGIIYLLTTPKVSRRAKKAKGGEDGYAEYTLVNTAHMPYEHAPGDADPFATLLMKTHAEHGRPAAEQLLRMVSPENRKGGGIPQVYERRMEGILNALDDGKMDDGSHKFNRQASHEYDHVHRMMDVYNKRPIGTPEEIKFSRGLRTVNNVSLLSFTTLTSLGDIVLPIIRAGRIGSAIKGWSKMTDPEYRKAIRNTGVAIENIMHERMIHGYGGNDSKISQAFFNGTLLTPWTDTQRKICASVGHQAFIAEQAKAQRHFVPNVPLEEQPRQFKQAWRFLKMYGLEDFAPNGPRKESLDFDDALKEPLVQEALIKFSNEAIFTPNADDVPHWGQGPWGSLIMQLKTFPLMIGRMGKEVLYNDIRLYLHDTGIRTLKNPEAVRGKGDPTRAAYFLTLGPAAGYGALTAKDIVQGRGGEENREHKPRNRDDSLMKLLGYDEKYHGDFDKYLSWYAEGMLLMGGLGLIGDLMHAAVQQRDNGAYGKMRLAGTVLGPSFGLAMSGFDIAAGGFDALTDGDTDGRGQERMAVREAARRVPVVGGISSVREAIVDGAFEPKSKSDNLFPDLFKRQY